MLRALLAWTLAFGAPPGASSTAPAEPVEPVTLATPLSHRGVEVERSRAQRRGLIVLTSWAGANIAVGGSLALAQRRRVDDPRLWFHATNASWNLINLGLGVGGMIGERRQAAARRDESPAASLARGRKTARVFAINLALDAVYMGTGGALALWSLDQSGRRAALAQGVGWGLLLQGGFLAVFDAGMWAIHADFNQRYQNFEWQLAPGPTARGASLRLRF